MYLFENASQKRARVEIANSAGTPDQDAFSGRQCTWEPEIYYLCALTSVLFRLGQSPRPLLLQTPMFAHDIR